MSGKKSLGGIGRLYHDELFLGEVYYNIQPGIQSGIQAGESQGNLGCRVVFLGREVALSADGLRYRLFLEDGQYLIVTLVRSCPGRQAYYLCNSCDRMFHTQLASV